LCIWISGEEEGLRVWQEVEVDGTSEIPLYLKIQEIEEL
jgi:hypothetical protein